jgi:hypothetical protein
MWCCSSIAAVCGAALLQPSLVSVVALVLVNPHCQSGVAASRNRYLGRIKKFEVLWRNFKETSNELRRDFEGTLKETLKFFRETFSLFSVPWSFFIQPCL